MSEPSTENNFVLFECDKCGYKHDIHIEDEFDPDSALPDGWLIVRSHVIGLETDDELVFCRHCKTAVLKALGYESHKEYEAVVKAVAEAERRNDIQHLQETKIRISAPSTRDKKSLN